MSLFKTKMIYPQRDNRRRRKKIGITIGIVAGVVLLCAVLNIWKPNLFTPVIHATGKPVLEARGGVLGSVSAVWEYLHSKSSLVSQNNDLHEKLALQEAIVAERDYYKQQNLTLQKLVARIQNDKKFTIAKIISKPGFSPYDTIIIDAGKAEGINAGDTILADPDSILGTVSNVFAHTSLVVLYSSPEKETQVLVGPKATQAIASGKGGGNFEIKLPKNTDIVVGDIVSMASTSAKIFGAIGVINASPTDSFERALFKNAADINGLSYIIIEKP
jgi:cell shape-determining protein MreC